MTAPAASAAWLKGPLAEPLLRFNLLPSTLMHSQQVERLLSPELTQAMAEDDLPPAVLHRHWSQLLMREFKLGSVLSLDDATLPVALLDVEPFLNLTFLCGLTLFATEIRRAITRTEVELLQEQLGEEGLAFARQDAQDLVQEPPSVGLDFNAAQQQAIVFGYGLMGVMFERATPSVGARGRLRLPHESFTVRQQLPQTLQEPAEALKLTRSVLQWLDSEWLSLFPPHP